MSTVATPKIAPVGGSYIAPQNITMECATEGAAIYYTTTGVDPTESDTLYTEAFEIGATTTIKAKAFLSGWDESDVATVDYVIELPAVEVNGEFPPELPAPSYGTNEDDYLPVVKDDFEGNYTAVRPGVTRARAVWENMTWTAMEEADYQTLKAFHRSHKGKPFYWTHPITSVVYLCVFSTDRLKSTFTDKGFRKVVCPMEEL
jgi:phage-related protein